MNEDTRPRSTWEIGGYCRYCNRPTQLRASDGSCGDDCEGKALAPLIEQAQEGK